ATAGVLIWIRSSRPLTPGQWALAELAILEQSELLATGQTDDFYCRLTDIVRRYIELRFGWSAPRQTTKEFLTAMQTESMLHPQHRASLQEFLLIADMVKFACLEPSPVQANIAIEKAQQFVESTAEADTETSEKEQVAA
ncbi:MAG: hypothetical protein N2C12_11150, partial [Planctomycetales bacterium]